MEFKKLIERAVEVRAKYVELEKKEYGRGWSKEELMLGFMKDLGDLAKLVQAKEGIRDVEDVDEKLAHELSDCLWSVIVLAHEYGVDLESSFVKTMEELDTKISSEV